MCPLLGGWLCLSMGGVAANDRSVSGLHRVAGKPTSGRFWIHLLRTVLGTRVCHRSCKDDCGLGVGTARDISNLGHVLPRKHWLGTRIEQSWFDVRSTIGELGGPSAAWRTCGSKFDVRENQTGR